MNFVSYADLVSDIYQLVNNYPQWHRATGIVAIPRSGILPATLLSLQLNLPMVDLETFLNTGGRFYPSRHFGRASGEFRSSHLINSHNPYFLLVDDSVCQGSTMKWALKEISSHMGLRHLNPLCVCIYTTEPTPECTYYKIVPEPRLFEWNWYRNPLLKEAMLDMDGVLCEDPTVEIYSDIRIYQDWIVSPAPKYIPTSSIRAVVSARLECYRAQTLQWLNQYSIQFQDLLLLNASKEERDQYNLHAPHKIEHYQQSASTLFIESDPVQALEIHKKTKKPVLCPTPPAKLYK